MKPYELSAYLEANGYVQTTTHYKLGGSNKWLMYCHKSQTNGSDPKKGAIIFKLKRKKAKLMMVKYVKEIDVLNRIYILVDLKQVKISSIKINSLGKLEGI